MKKQTYISERALVSHAKILLAYSAIAAAILFYSTIAGASALGTAGEFNTFIFGDFSCSSDTEGRLAVGGNATLDHYSVADKLTSAEQARYQDMLVVGGDLTFSGGRVYYGNILVGGSGAGINEPQAGADGDIIVGAALPIDFTAEEAYLKALSQELAALTPTGTAKSKDGGLKISGDGKSDVQVFNVDGAALPSLTWVHELKKVPSDAILVFNISGDRSGLTGGWQRLTPFRNRVLYNFYEATTLSLKFISVEGSILAPYAHVDNPQGVIYGTIVAASWNGAMQQNHFPFEEGGLPEPEKEQNAPVGDVTCGTADVDGDYGEWDLTEDLFAEMHEAGAPSKAHMSNLYLRYDVVTETMYALVLQEGNWVPEKSVNDAWIKIYDLGQSPLVDGSSSDFQWVYDGGTLIGYEAAFAIVNGLYAEFEAHISVDGGRTSSTGKKNKGGYIPLTVDCPELPEPEPAGLGDFVWFDADENGIQDDGESGASGVTVKLYTCAGDPVAEITTDDKGHYLFEELARGAYYVEFSKLPAGYVFTEQGPTGTSDATDSDAIPTMGKTECTTLESGENDLSWDAGIVKGAGISKYQRFDDSDEWSVDPLYGLQTGETLSYQISVENFNYADDLGFTLLDSLSELVEFDSLRGVEKVDAYGNTAIMEETTDYFFNYDNDLHALSLDYISTLQSDETLNFLFDVTANDGFGSDMVVANQADVTFNGESRLDSNIVNAYAVPEPGTIVLLGLGLFGIFGLKRKFKKS